MLIRRLTILSVFLVMLGFFSAPALAADKQELQTRFERRYPQLLQYKTQGKIGETMQGFVEAVDSSAGQDQTIAKLISEENADRRELYKLIAAEEKTTADLVASRTAKRNYENARKGEFLKGEDGSWKKKT
jgi:uncharacterized protein YdbL (DUF1318 family)